MVSIKEAREPSKCCCWFKIDCTLPQDGGKTSVLVDAQMLKIRAPCANNLVSTNLRNNTKRANTPTPMDRSWPSVVVGSSGWAWDRGIEGDCCNYPLASRKLYGGWPFVSVTTELENNDFWPSPAGGKEEVIPFTIDGWLYLRIRERERETPLRSRVRSSP